MIFSKITVVKPVEVGVARPLNIEVPAADVIDGLVVDHEGAVAVLKGGVIAQGRVLRLSLIHI